MAKTLTKEQLDRVVEVLEYSVRQKDSHLQTLDPSDITVRFLLQECVGIIEATKKLGLAHAQYIRQLVWKGNLESVKVDLGQYKKWYVTKESISYYSEHHLRANQPRRYIIRIYPEDERQVRNALDATGIEYELEVGYRKPADNDGSLDALKEA